MYGLSSPIAHQRGSYLTSPVAPLPPALQGFLAGKKKYLVENHAIRELRKGGCQKKNMQTQNRLFCQIDWRRGLLSKVRNKKKRVKRVLIGIAMDFID